MEDFRFNRSPDDDEDEELSLLERIKREKVDAEKKKEKEAEARKRKQKKDETVAEDDALEAESRTKKATKEAFLLKTLMGEKGPDDSDGKKIEEDNKKSKETEASSEEEPIERLTHEERRLALKEYIQRRQAQLEQEDLSDDGNESQLEQVQRQAQRTFLQRFSQMLGLQKAGESVPKEDDMLENASAETIAFMQQHSPLEDDEAPDESTLEADARRVDETLESPSADDSYDSDQENWEQAEELILGKVERTDDVNVTQAAELGGDKGTPLFSSENSPQPTTADSFVSSFESVRSSPGRKSHERATNSTSGATEFLLGGFVGYLFGKRRGRIKSESEQAPVRKKLESEVKALESKVSSYERRVRVEARAIVERKPVSTEPKSKSTSEKPIAYKAESQDVSPAFQEVNRLDSNELMQEAAAEIGIPYSLRKAPEKAKSVAPPLRAESPSKQNMGIEGVAYSLPPVEIMQLSAILQEAKTVSFGEGSVKDVFERGEIDEKTLREVIKMKRAGGESYKEAIRRQIRSFEKQEQKNSFSPPDKEREAQQSSFSDEKASNDVSSSGSPGNIREQSNSTDFRDKIAEPNIFMNAGKKSPSPQAQFLTGIAFGVILVVFALVVLL